MLKNILAAAILATFTFGTSQCELPPEVNPQINMSYDAKAVVAVLNCDYISIPYMNNAIEIASQYNALAEQGKKDGYYPVIVVPSPVLTELLGYIYMHDDVYDTPDEIAASRREIISEAEGIDTKEFFTSRLDYDMVYGGGSGYDYLGSFVPAAPQNSLSLFMLDYGECDDVVIAKIPVENPWEIAAWMPTGGFNACPSPAEQVAVFKYWYEQYGAVPAVVTYDTWQMTLTNPPATKESAEALAMEQFAFCYDIVEQGTETVRALASSLINSKAWYFWWD